MVYLCVISHTWRPTVRDFDIQTSLCVVANIVAWSGSTDLVETRDDERLITLPTAERLWL